MVRWCEKGRLCYASRWRLHSPPPSDKKILLLGESFGIYNCPRGSNLLTLALSFPKARCVHILFITVMFNVTPLLAKVIEKYKLTNIQNMVQGFETLISYLLVS